MVLLAKQPRYVVKAESQCGCAYLGRSLATCLLKPRFCYPNVPSQCVCTYPMCLRNASAPPNAPSQCVCASQCVCVFQCVFIQCVFRMRLRLLMRLRQSSLFLTNASSQCGCVFRSFVTLYEDPAMCMHIYIYTHTCRGRGTKR